MSSKPLSSHLQVSYKIGDFENFAKLTKYTRGTDVFLGISRNLKQYISKHSIEYIRTNDSENQRLSFV